MNNFEYVQAAVRTESVDFEQIRERLFNQRDIRILHALMGLTTEIGEAMDAMKKYVFYGKPLDFINMQEEAGDLFWYMALLADACGFAFDTTMERNIAKLKARYPDRFNEKEALFRNLNRERQILEEPRTAKGSLD